ncbi:unnamed protein product [Brachionus calyciflorus]|uniref:Uncharacterized protein n=1 Tax=Brachionus calyciflorus TaxID=104777 RepID=A0A813M4R1_9BILA|nr:unnamed protein product [Brachionus calyciflorus]
MDLLKDDFLMALNQRFDDCNDIIIKCFEKSNRNNELDHLIQMQLEEISIIKDEKIYFQTIRQKITNFDE